MLRHHSLLQGGSTLTDRTRLQPPDFRHFSLPFRGTFQLSLAVLVRYRSWDVFSRGSCFLPDSRTQTGVRYSGTPALILLITSRGLSPSTAGRSRPFRLQLRESGRAL